MIPAARRFAIFAGLLVVVTGAAVISFSWSSSPEFAVATEGQEARAEGVTKVENVRPYVNGAAAVRAAALAEKRDYYNYVAAVAGTQEEVEDVIAFWPVAVQQTIPAELTPEQVSAMQSVSQSFARAMQNAGDPGSSEYVERWLAEQERADELLMAYLGPEVFSHLHRQNE